ncbi:ABC transporter ATP-binding protein [Psychromarinibacter sp. S121]|uniref:ABC transporter ATP-binding protein n=1 Tax=Psychromarinibacter sp. S121 TaxID=3415127 RepID=UPI003C7CC17F
MTQTRPAEPGHRGVYRLSPDRAPDPRPVALRFEDLSMTYPDGTEALTGIDLSIAAGEFVSIIGPSGCGKSTLARIASGLLPQTGGTVRIDRDHLAFTFQEATLLPWRRVLGNVELMMELRGVPAAERKRKALEQLDLVGLKGFEDRFPRALSGGMKMRASLARSFALDPTVFLFDEPFGALDEINRERLIEELSALHRAKGFTGFFITHSIPEAVYLSSRVVVMGARPGRIEAEYAIDLPQPRNAELRFDPAFTEGCAEISHCLRGLMQPDERTS